MTAKINNHKLWAISISLTILTFVGINVTSNLVFDYYGVFNTGISEKAELNSNQRYRKIEFLNQNPVFNAYLLGSSRMGHFNMSVVDHYSKHSNTNPLSFYNLGVFSGTAGDYLKFVKYLVEHNHSVDYLMIGLDIYPLFKPPQLNKPHFKHHPSITGESVSSNYFYYLFQTGFTYLAAEPGYYFGDDLPIYTHNYKTGTYVPNRSIAESASDFSTYWDQQLDKASKGQNNFKKNVNTINSNAVREVQELVSFLFSHKIDFDVFVQPMHPENQLYYSRDQLEFLPILLSEIADNNFVDLHNLDCLLFNNENFYDLMHYKPVVANEIARQVLYPESNDHACPPVPLLAQ